MEYKDGNLKNIYFFHLEGINLLAAVAPNLFPDVPGRRNDSKDGEIREGQRNIHYFQQQHLSKMFKHDSLTLMCLCEKHCIHFHVALL